jgi:hypothetical protein
MLIEQFAGALSALFLELTFGPGAAEPGAVGGGFLLRPLLRDALPELFQIDQIPHGGPRHVNLVVVTTMPPIDELVRVPSNLTRSKFSGCALASSILIYEFPIMPSDRKNVVGRFSKYFLLYHGEAPP